MSDNRNRRRVPRRTDYAVRSGHTVPAQDGYNLGVALIRTMDAMPHRAGVDFCSGLLAALNGEMWPNAGIERPPRK